MSYDDNSVSMEDLPAIAAGLKQATDEVKKQHAKNDARLRELEQKLARDDGGDIYFDAPARVGAQVADLEGIRLLSQGQRGTVSLSVKALTSLPDSAGGFATPDRSIPVPLFRPRPSLRDVLAVSPIYSGAAEYVRRTSHTQGAETQVEGDLKGESDLSYELVTAPVRTIATWIPASKQILDDAPGLARMVDYDLTRNLRDVEEAQLLYGDGTGANLLGIIPLATAFAAPWTITSPTMIDTLLLALAQLESDTENEAGFIALNPLDWRRIQGLKATDGNYLSGSAFSQSDIERLWSLPVVATPGMAVDHFLVGDRSAAHIRDRQQATVEVSTEDRDNFIRNMVTIRAEERIALEVNRPWGFVHGEFGN